MYYLKLILLLCTLLTACATITPQNLVDHQGNKVDINDTKTCLDCHDDMKDHSHPYMVDYPPVGKQKGYASAAAVAKSGIKLVDGKITCITCHDLMNNEPGHLAKTMDNSQLCLACHIK